MYVELYVSIYLSLSLSVDIYTYMYRCVGLVDPVWVPGPTRKGRPPVHTFPVASALMSLDAQMDMSFSIEQYAVFV